MTTNNKIKLCIIVSIIMTICVMSMLSVCIVKEERANPIEYLEGYLSGETQTGKKWITDNNGNVWEVGDLPIGEDDQLIIAIDSNNTKRLHDDVVVGVYSLVTQSTEAQE